MKFLLFGTGDYYQRYKKWFVNDDVIAVLDNNAEKQGHKIDGLDIIAPCEAVGLTYDYIVILSFYVKAMKAQLIELGVPSDKILHFFELYKLGLTKKVDVPLKLYGKTMEEIINERENSVLLLSTDLELQGGPATVLIRMAYILKKNGYNVIFGTMMDGAQREKLTSVDIPVVVDARLQIDRMADIEWVHGFKHIVCNTVGYSVFVSDRNDKSTPVTWWLHDSKFFFEGLEKNLLKNMDFDNLHIVSVGKIPKQAFLDIVPYAHVDELLYGVDEEKNEHQVKFMVLGYIESRKGQDILFEAIQQIPEQIRRNAVFYFVGKDTSVMAENIKAKSINISEIIITGIVSGLEKNLLLKDIDVLICPSREDPMPAVVVEAMKNRKATIVSSACGIAEYIRERVNGLVFESENVDDLKNKIIWCIENNEKLAGMGNCSYEIFRDKFSMESYEEQVLKIVKGNTNV